jgi:hypothetical protein
MDKFGPAGITALNHHLTIVYVYPCYIFYVDDDVPLTLPEINYLMSYVLSFFYFAVTSEYGRTQRTWVRRARGRRRRAPTIP